MKKNIVLLVIFLVLAGIAVFFYYSQKNNTFTQSDTGFIIKDTSEINSIYIVNSSDSLLLIKSDKGWSVSNSYPANYSMMNLCFKIFNEIEIKSSVSKEMEPRVAAFLKEKGARVEVSDEDENIRAFYIFPDAINRVVYIMMQHCNTPYIVELPSYKGNFAGLFFSKKTDWRNNTIIALNSKSLQSISVENTKSHGKSFNLSFSEDQKPKLSQLNNSTEIPVNTEAVNQYLLGFKNVTVKEFIYKQSITDSLNKATPNFKIKIKEVSGSEMKISVYAKGTPPDLNNCYLLIDSTNVAIASYVVTDPLTVDLDFFKSK